jgi:isopentenyl diphosphate isomerase/L-lactate dehydrogenase-like FMN-dependent dehydrogenase
MGALDKCYNVADLAALAKRRMPRGLHEFIDRGAEDEVTTRENREAIKRVLIRQRVGIDVAATDCTATVLGRGQAMPITIGVTGMIGMVSHRGEQKLGAAAAAAGIPYTIGSHNFASLAEMREICGDLLWRQLYPPRTPDLLQHQLRITREAGIRVLVMTMDSPVAGNREYMLRNGFMPGMFNLRAALDALTSPRWLLGTLLRYQLSGGLPQLSDMPEGHRIFFGKGNTGLCSPASDFTWDTVRQIRREWSGMLVLKGLSAVEDAITAAEIGVDGIIVSNHGGRSLDGCVPSMGALPGIVDAVGSRAQVMVDGSFVRGVDVLKAIALGAKCVMVGRATAFGLAAGGEAGVSRALAILRDELHRGMALIGVRRLDELNRANLQF